MTKLKKFEENICKFPTNYPKLEHELDCNGKPTGKATLNGITIDNKLVNDIFSKSHRFAVGCST